MKSLSASYRLINLSMLWGFTSKHNNRLITTCSPHLQYFLALATYWYLFVAPKWNNLAFHQLHPLLYVDQLYNQVQDCSLSWTLKTKIHVKFIPWALVHVDISHCGKTPRREQHWLRRSQNFQRILTWIFQTMTKWISRLSDSSTIMLLMSQHRRESITTGSWAWKASRWNEICP